MTNDENIDGNTDDNIDENLQEEAQNAAPNQAPNQAPVSRKKKRMREISQMASYLEQATYPQDSEYTESLLGVQAALLNNTFALLLTDALDSGESENLTGAALAAALRAQRQCCQTLGTLELLRRHQKKRKNSKSTNELMDDPSSGMDRWL